jgi:hypothetical protein
MARSVSAIPTPATLVEREPVRVPGLEGLALAGRTLALLALALLVPGGAERIGARIAPRDPR